MDSDQPNVKQRTEVSLGRNCRKLQSNSNKTKIASPRRTIRDPASRKFAIDGIEPPKSIPPPRVTFAMTASVAQLLQADAARNQLYHLLGMPTFSFSPDRWHRMCHSLAATRPPYIVVFCLDSRVTLRHNPRQQPSVTGEFGSRNGLRRKRRYGH